MIALYQIRVKQITDSSVVRLSKLYNGRFSIYKINKGFFFHTSRLYLQNSISIVYF